MVQPLDVCVVGLGYFSQFHLSAWGAIDGISIAGVMDPDLDCVAGVEKSYAVTGYADLEAMLGACDPDIVDIVAPPVAHADLIRRLACSNCTIICQKPFCTSILEAEEMIELAEQKGCRLVIHENFRFQPWYRTIKSFIDDDGLGTIYQCRFALRPGDGRGEFAYQSRQPAFRSMPRLLIYETAVHFIDLFRWFFGDIDAIYSDIRQLNPVLAGEDAGLMILDHDSGVQSLFDGNRLCDHVSDNPRRTMGEMVIEGEKGALRLDGNGQLYFRAFGAATETPVPLIADVDDNSFGGGCVAALIRHVVVAVRQGVEPENLARDYLPVIQATEAAYVSAHEGRKKAL